MSDKRLNLPPNPNRGSGLPKICPDLPSERPFSQVTAAHQLPKTAQPAFQNLPCPTLPPRGGQGQVMPAQKAEPNQRNPVRSST